MRKIKIIFFIFIIFLCPINGVCAEELGELSSKNVILYNLNDNSILIDKNSEEKTLIASMTKIMTAIVAIENIDDLDEKVVLTDNIFKDLSNDLSFAGFKVNEEVTYRDLLYGTLLPSGADATHSLAILITGSEDNFVKLMNDKANELNLKNTHFTNTIGIETDDNMHYSSVSDVATLLKYCLNNQKFKKIFSSDKYKTTDGLLNFKSSKLKASEKYEIDLSFINGSKTGYTSHAGLCLASIASYKGVDYMLVTAGADYKDSKINHFLDAKKIYEYYFSNYSYKKILKKDKLIEKIKTKYDEEINLTVKEDVMLYLKNDIEISNLDYEYVGKKVLDKETKKGDKIGEYLVKNNNEVICKIDVLSPITVKFKLKRIYKLMILIPLITIIFSKMFIFRLKKIK